MAAPAYATDLVDIIAEMPNTTGWTLISDGGGGGNSLTAPETDDFIQGGNSISRSPWTSANVRGMVYNSAQTIPAGDAVFFWWKADVAAALRTIANGGIQCLIGNATTALKAYYVAGSDTYALGGWRCSPIDPTTTQSGSIGTPTSVTSQFGVRWAVAVSGPQRGFPFKIDAIRRGRDIEVTAGEIANPATWNLLATHADETSRRWGIVQGTNTGAAVQGRVFWGTAAALVYSRDQNRTITLTDTLGFTTTDFTQIIVANAATDLVWTNISVSSLDTLNRGIVSVQNNASAQFLSCNFADINTTADGGTNSVWDGSTWRRCNAVTAAGGSFVGCGFLAPTVALNTSALVWNIATDTAGLLDDAEFTRGVNAHHAIEFGLTSPTTINLTGLSFSGFNAANGQNDSVLHIKRTTGTVTINLSGVTGTVSYRTDGATVVLVSSNTLELTGLRNPTEVRVFAAGTTTEIAGSENVTSGTFSTGIDAATYPNIDIAVISLGYQNLRLLNISMATDRSIPISQVVDRQYENP